MLDKAVDPQILHHPTLLAIHLHGWTAQFRLARCVRLFRPPQLEVVELDPRQALHLKGDVSRLRRSLLICQDMPPLSGRHKSEHMLEETARRPQSSGEGRPYDIETSDRKSTQQILDVVAQRRTSKWMLEASQRSPVMKYPSAPCTLLVPASTAVPATLLVAAQAAVATSMRRIVIRGCYGSQSTVS